MSHCQNGLQGYGTPDSWAWPNPRSSVCLWVRFICCITTKMKPFVLSCLLCLNSVHINFIFLFRVLLYSISCIPRFSGNLLPSRATNTPNVLRLPFLRAIFLSRGYYPQLERYSTQMSRLAQIPAFKKAGYPASYLFSKAGGKNQHIFIPIT